MKASNRKNPYFSGKIISSKFKEKQEDKIQEAPLKDEGMPSGSLFVDVIRGDWPPAFRKMTPWEGVGESPASSSAPPQTITFSPVRSSMSW